MAFDLYHWLDRIEMRPGMYLGDGGFDALNAFVMGHSLARPSAFEYPPFHKFQEWLLQKTRGRGLQVPEFHPMLGIEVSYIELIRILAANDQTDAMEAFFRYLHEYRQSS